MNDIKFPQKTILLDFGDKNEAYEVKFPKTGTLINIFTLKSKLLSGQSSNVMINDGLDSYYVVILAEMEAHFTYVMPKEFWDALAVKSISELDAIDSARLIEVYVKQYSPWFAEWIAILQNGGKMLESKQEEAPNQSIPRID